MKKQRNRREAGLKSYETRLRHYGSQYISEQGRKYGQLRKIKRGGCNIAGHAKAIGKKGGVMSRRSRVITPTTPLRTDEWSMLSACVNSALGKLRLSENSPADVMTQHIGRGIVMDLWAKGDWITVMTNIAEKDGVSGYEYRSALYGELDSRRSFYQKLEMEGKISDAQKNEYRILRNLITAMKVAGKEKNVK